MDHIGMGRCAQTGTGIQKALVRPGPPRSIMPHAISVPSTRAVMLAGRAAPATLPQICSIGCEIRTPSGRST